MACNTQACLMMFQDFMKEHGETTGDGKGSKTVPEKDQTSQPNSKAHETNGETGEQPGNGAKGRAEESKVSPGGSQAVCQAEKKSTGAAVEGHVYNEEHCKHVNIKESPISVAINF